MKEPLVSVVIPFYSELDWLIEALESVKNQNYKNIEVLVINDGSKEDISRIEGKYSFDLKIIRKENGGPSSARNLGIEKSSGKYIAFLDSDDIWLPQKLEKQIKEMENNNYVWSHHSYEMFWENSNKHKVINTEMFSGNVYKDCFISFKVQTSCVVVLRNVLIENNIQFPLEKRYGQDIDFYKQLAKNYQLGYINEVLSKFRIRGTNAGLRSRVQIGSRAVTWNEIKNNNNILRMLPKSVILAYKLSYINNEIIELIVDKVQKRSNLSFIEWLSKIMYIVPYILFKINAKKS